MLLINILKLQHILRNIILFIEKLKINEEQLFDCDAQSQTPPQKLHLPLQDSLTTSYTYMHVIDHEYYGKKLQDTI